MIAEYYKQFTRYTDLYTAAIASIIFIFLTVMIGRRYALKKTRLCLILFFMYLSIMCICLAGFIGFISWERAVNMTNFYRYMAALSIGLSLVANLMLFFFSETVFADYTKSPERKWFAAFLLVLTVVLVILFLDIRANNYLGYMGEEYVTPRLLTIQIIWILTVFTINMQALFRFVSLYKRMKQSEEDTRAVRSIIRAILFQILALILVPFDTVVPKTIPLLTDLISMMLIMLIFVAYNAYRGFILQK